MPQRRAQCGTDSGYYRHLRTTKTEPCDACRRAHAAANAHRERTEDRTCELCSHPWRATRTDKHTRCRACRSGPVTAPKLCGTTRAYWRHLRLGEQPCDPCKQAYNARRKAIREGKPPPVEQPLSPAAATGPPARRNDVGYRGQWIRRGGVLIPLQEVSSEPISA